MNALLNKKQNPDSLYPGFTFMYVSFFNTALLSSASICGLFPAPNGFHFLNRISPGLQPAFY